MHSDLALSRTQTSVSISISRAKPVCTCNSEARLSLAASSADALFPLQQTSSYQTIPARDDWGHAGLCLKEMWQI